MSRSNNRTAVGLLAALAIVAVIFYFSTAARSTQNTNPASAVDSNAPATASGLRGTPPPTTTDDAEDNFSGWDDDPTTSNTETPTAVVFESGAFEWRDLPPYARTAAATLGYTRESWDGDTLREHRRWNDLSLTEKEAAKALGYSPSYWDEIVYEDGMQPESTTQILHHNNDPRDYDNDEDYDEDYDYEEDATATPTSVAWDSFDWDDLPRDKRDAASKLGFTEDTWDEWTNIPTTPWKDLTTDQLAAAESLDFDEAYWQDMIEDEMADDDYDYDYDDDEFPDNDNDNDESTETPTTFAWDSFDWEDLPDDMRDAASQLGFTEDSWDEWTNIPRTPWDDLTTDQQVAAHALDWNRVFWDEMIESTSAPSS